MRLMARWSVAATADVAAFAVSWWVAQEQVRLDQGTALAVAGAVLGVVAPAGGKWAAGGERRAGQAPAGAVQQGRAGRDVTIAGRDQTIIGYRRDE